MIVKLNELSKLRKDLKNKSIVFCSGVFDVFHSSHVKAFKRLRSDGDIVIVGIVSDKRVRERKGEQRPILSQTERREIVDAIKYVDYAVQMPPSSRSGPFPTITVMEKLRPDIFVSVDKKWLKYKKEINDLGVKLKIVKRVHPTSSTSIIQRILRKYN